MKSKFGARPLALILLVLASFTVNAQGVAWEDLSREQRGVLTDQTETSWAELSPVRQERIARGAERYLEMNRRELRAAQERFTRWGDLSDSQRTELRRNYETFRRLPVIERDRLRDVYQRFNRQPRDRQIELRQRFERLTPDRRQDLRDRVLRPTDRR